MCVCLCVCCANSKHVSGVGSQRQACAAAAASMAYHVSMANSIACSYGLVRVRENAESIAFCESWSPNAQI